MTGGENLAVHQDGNAIGQAEHDAHIVFHHDQRLTLRHTAHQLYRIARLRQAHACGRLVEQDDIGTARDGDADLERTLLSVR